MKIERWSSRYVFMLAVIGSAVGLGNIWKFPYIAGEYGGGAFVFLYLICIAVVGFPLLIAEMWMGKAGQNNAVISLRVLAQKHDLSPKWSFFGYVGMVTIFIVLSFYSVVAGWGLDYAVGFAQGKLNGLNAQQIEDAFGELLADPYTLIMWHSAFMLVTAFVVGKGLHKGLEPFINLMMPLLFVLFVVLVIYAATLSSFGSGLRYLFSFDASKINIDAVLAALGHAFFTLSIGMGIVMVFSSYLSPDIPVARMAMSIALVDTGIALAAGMAIFPVIFAYGLEPSAGPSLLFISLPTALLDLPLGQLWGVLFFVLIAIAAWTSAFTSLEAIVRYLEQKFIQCSRALLTFWVVSAIWLLGVGVALSFNVWNDVHILGERNLFDTLDYVASNILLPLGGFGLSLFAGWFVARKIDTNTLCKQLGMSSMWLHGWKWCTGIITPAVIIVLLIQDI